MATDLRIEGYPWPEFREWFAATIEPGQHLGFVGPTGSGKTTFWSQILPLRKWVLAFDPKGGDSTLRATRFPRLTSWPPPRKVYRDIEKGKPYRVIVGKPVQRMEEFPALRALFRTALREAFADGGWTLYIDELQVACDPRIMGLAAETETLLIAARDRGVSVFSSFQRPARVPRTATDQATWFGVAFQRDADVVNRLAEMAGRPKPEMRGIMSELPPYTLALFSNNPRDPVVVTRPPELRRVNPRDRQESRSRVA